MAKITVKIIDFIRESINEFKRITWPTREALVGGTIGVFLVAAFFVIYMWILDIIIAKAIQLIIG